MKRDRAVRRCRDEDIPSTKWHVWYTFEQTVKEIIARKRVMASEMGKGLLLNSSERRG